MLVMKFSDSSGVSTVVALTKVSQSAFTLESSWSAVLGFEYFLISCVASPCEFGEPKRKITVLYPASGSHVTPLDIAHRLIQEGLIDEAKFIFTEIDKDSLGDLRGVLLSLAKTGLYTDLSESTQIDPSS